VTPEDLGALFGRFERTAFRLEARDVYTVPEENARLEAFRAGRELPPRTTEEDEWLALVARQTAAGRTIGRVRVVGHPLTDYTRFELAVYPENIAAGEQVRLVERSALSTNTEGRWDEDFWLFDQSTAVVLRYDSEGRFLGVEEGLPVERYREIEREALARSLDLAQFRSRVALIGR
jgi:hypothetical protein